MTVPLDEAQLIERAKAGDTACFELLIESCRTKAYNTALRYLRDEQDALDVLQESMLKVYRHLGQFKADSRFDTWVYRIVVNTCNDFLRKNQFRYKVDSLHRVRDEEETTLDLPDRGPTPAQALDAKETMEMILACLEQIDPEQKEVIVLRDIQGFSYDEISEILQCSIGTVKSRINRARHKLRDLIREQNGGLPV